MTDATAPTPSPYRDDETMALRAEIDALRHNRDDLLDANARMRAQVASARRVRVLAGLGRFAAFALAIAASAALFTVLTGGLVWVSTRPRPAAPPAPPPVSERQHARDTAHDYLRAIYPLPARVRVACEDDAGAHGMRPCVSTVDGRVVTLRCDGDLSGNEGCAGVAVPELQ